MASRELTALREPLGGGCVGASGSAGGVDGATPLERPGRGDPEDPVTVDDLQSYLAHAGPPSRRGWLKSQCFSVVNCLTLLGVLVGVVLLLYEIFHLAIANFEAIWRNSFVAALFLGALGWALRGLAQWVAVNIFARFFLTTIKLSKDTKEATPVLEWFKVWLPRMMNERGKKFRSVQPLFRKKDGSTFFSFLRDIRRRDKYELISWVTPGTHFFQYKSAELGGNILILMHYQTGEAKKEGWDQSLTVMETVFLTCFDPYGQRMPYLMEMLTEAQERFAERDMDCLRFQEWHGWKQMWESSSPDERIAPNFRTLAFYPEELLARVEFEVEQFLNTPDEVLLRAGLPLKLGFLFHGPPGTGKTNLVRYMAAKYRLPINIVDCNSGHMDNIQLLHAVVSAEGIVLFEDIDNLDAACGRVRENLGLLGSKAQVNKSVTLDGLLNALDGVHRGTQKRILIATTNYPEKLIQSIRRRGRFGFSLQVDFPQDAVLETMLRYYAPSLPRQPIVDGFRAVEKSCGLRLSTAAAVDIIAKASLRLQQAPGGQAAEGIVAEAREVLQELQQSNGKRLLGSFELLELLQLQEYAANFYWSGLYDMRYVKLLDNGELEKIGIARLGDRKKILDAFQYMEDTPPLSGPELHRACEGLRAMCGTKVVIFTGLAAFLRDVFPDEERAKEVEDAFREQGLGNIDAKGLKSLDKDKHFDALGIKKFGEVARMKRLVDSIDERSQ